MLIAVGMYLPFYATAGHLRRRRLPLDHGHCARTGEKRRDDARKAKAENTGVLISSGLIAGGALTAVVIAFIVLGYNPPWVEPMSHPEFQAWRTGRRAGPETGRGPDLHRPGAHVDRMVAQRLDGV